MAEVGSLQWELKRGGRLSRLDRLMTSAESLRQQWLRRLRRSPQAARRVAEVSLDAIRIPDTAAARAAYEACAAASSADLLNHCVRTFLFGALFGEAGKLRYDVELLYTSSLLHDLGLTPTHADQGADCRCFAVAGARAAYRLSESWGWPQVRRAQMREAIVRHINSIVTLSVGAEAHLLHAGAGADVLGARLKELPVQVAREVIVRHPRGDFANELATAMREEARRHPSSRIALWERTGFSQAVAADRPARLCQQGGSPKP